MINKGIETKDIQVENMHPKLKQTINHLQTTTFTVGWRAANTRLQILRENLIYHNCKLCQKHAT